MKPVHVPLPELKLEIYHFPCLFQPFPPHFHDAQLVGCLLQGSRLLDLPTETKKIGQNECLTLPAGYPHACKPANNLSADWICLHIRGDISGILAPSCFHDEALAGLFQKLANAQAKREASEIAEDILKHINGISPHSGLSIQSNHLAQTDKLNPPHFSEELAKFENNNSDKYRFLRSFRASAGITPHRYLTALRISHSQALLRKGEQLSNCAQASVFFDQSHFCRCFKSRLGISPGLYRKSWLSASK